MLIWPQPPRTKGRPMKGKMIRKLQIQHHKKKKQKEQFDEYFFCGAAGHKKKQCTNYHAWCVKKGMLLNLICFEVNLTSVH